MINLFLRARHWHLFLLAFGIPFLLQAVAFGWIAGNAVGNQTPDMASIFQTIMILFVVLLPFALITYLWQWSVVHGLRTRLPAEVDLPLRRFRIFFFIPLAYFALIIAGVFSMFIYMATTPLQEPPLTWMPMVFLFIPVHFFALFCTFYCFYFVAKTIKSVELGREAEFQDYIGEMVLVWFFAIGVWILQPRINRVLRD